MSKSTDSPPWTTVSVLALAPHGDARAPARALLRTAQRLTPPGLRLDLFDLRGPAAPGASAALWDAVAEHDALLLATEGQEAEVEDFAAFLEAGPDGALHDKTVAVVCAGCDPRADAGVQRLRQALRAVRACLMPSYDLGTQPGHASDRSGEQGMARLLDDIRGWAQQGGCGSILSATSSDR